MRGLMHQLALKVRNAEGVAADEIKTRLEEQLSQHVKYYDLTIQFIGASGLPRLDIVGSADPYFVATIDKATFT
jgi:hypothetical protein